MAVSRLVPIVCAFICLPALTARAQSVVVDASQTAGYSTEDVGAAATQVRVSGDAPAGIHLFAEGAWAVRSDTTTDAFGAAYPYSDRVQVIEAYGERMFRPRQGIVGVRGGRYRTPFGISNASDHAYLGFLRAPLIRYDGYFALSNNFRELGVDVIVGVPRLLLETSVGVPADVGTADRRAGADLVLRGQGVAGPLIVGLSYINTNPYQPSVWAPGRARFTGIDVRWMRDGVQARGEWIAGRPFDGTTTAGGYADLIIHRPFMGVVTALLRAERLAYDTAPPFALFAHRYTAGVRIRLLQTLAAQIALVHQSHALSERKPTPLDIALTYSIRLK
jgi:hypothetical protein